MKEKKITSIGGQAVIEGVMMRGPFKTAVAVRKPDGEIIIKETENKVKGNFRKIPILRGIFGFVNSMVIGINALMFSAQFYEEDGSPKQEENDSKNEGKASDNDEKKVEDKSKSDTSNELSGFALFLTLASSLAISIGLFFVLPNLIASLIVPAEEEAFYVSGDYSVIANNQNSGEVAITNVATLTQDGQNEDNIYISGEIANSSGDTKLIAATTDKPRRNNVLYNVVESIVKICIFIGYLALVSQMKDIKRVFEYHGAEHKTIFCYENREELTPENVIKYKRFHPRCGTSFLLFVIIISIIFYSIVGRHENLLINVAIRLALLPLIAGVSYEIIRFAGKHADNKIISILNKPGMLLQRLTTREPDKTQIECAIAALKAVMPEDEKADQW